MAITSPAERTVRRDSGADKEQMLDTAGGATMRQDEHRFTSKSDLTGQRRVDPLGDTHGCSNECFEYGGRPKWVAPSRLRLSSAYTCSGWRIVHAPTRDIDSGPRPTEPLLPFREE